MLMFVSAYYVQVLVHLTMATKQENLVQVYFLTGDCYYGFAYNVCVVNFKQVFLEAEFKFFICMTFLNCHLCLLLSSVCTESLFQTLIHITFIFVFDVSHT